MAIGVINFYKLHSIVWLLNADAEPKWLWTLSHCRNSCTFPVSLAGISAIKWSIKLPGQVHPKKPLASFREYDAGDEETKCRNVKLMSKLTVLSQRQPPAFFFCFRMVNGTSGAVISKWIVRWISFSLKLDWSRASMAACNAVKI